MTTCAGCGTTSDTDTPPEGWIEHYGVYGCDACRVGFKEDVEQKLAKMAFDRWTAEGFFVCWCKHCKPGWRNSKRDARIAMHIDGDPFRKFGLPPLFINKARA